ncbi:MAG: immunoglobulin domain-containing protein [Bacteroidota bacterium]
MMRQLRSTFALAICWGLSVLSVFAQSNPTPYSLASGNYSLTSFNATTTNTEPNLAFHIIGVQDPFLTTETTGDYTGTFNGTSGSRVNALGANGFSFTNTGTSGFQGAAVLGLNTTGRTNVRVTWTGATVLAGARDYRIRLQYRVGTTGAFTDVLNAGTPVEYVGSTTGNSAVFGPVTLPVAAENQAVVQLRWKYYYVSGSGTRPSLSVDDISVTSQASVGSPTKLAVTAISPVSPSNVSPFSITVTAQDASNSPKNVTAATNVTLSLATGTGTLGGTLTGTIPAGQSQIVFNNVTYNTVQTGVSVTATRTSGDALTAGTSALFNVQQGATQLAFVNFPATGYTGFRISNFTVEARKPDGTIDTTYSNSVTLSQATGTGLQGNLTRTAFRGVALFNDTANISFATPGTFTLRASSGTLTSVVSSSITITQTPIFNDVVIPQYIKSGGSINRVPAFALIRLDSLQPNTTYRYFSGAAGPATSSASIGGGNNMHYNATTQTYVYSTLRQLNATGGYSTFKTAANQRSMLVWLNLTPTTNAAFNVGTNVQWILSLGDSTGVQIARYLSTATSKAIDFGTTPTTATGVADKMSLLTPKNFVLLYDNEAGTGAPISTAIVQEDGVEIGATALYYAALDGVPTSWATILPNTLPNGVRRIEERSYNNSIVTIRTDSDGTWHGVRTVNPAGGDANPIYLETPQVVLIYPDSANVCSLAPLDLEYYAQGIDSVSIQVSNNGGRTYQELGRRSGMDSVFSVPTALQVAGTQYSFRVISTQDTTVGDTSGVFSISSPVVITRQPVSANVCEGSSVTIGLVAQGTGVTYQLQKEDPNAQGGFSNVTGATGAQYTIQNTQQSNAGTYRIVVSGSSPCPSVVSDNFIISVIRPTRVVEQPENQKTIAGGTVTLTAGFEATEPVTYQWRRGTQILSDNAKYSGTTSSVLTIRNVQQTEIDETYTVTATGLCGSATSNAARVSIVNLIAGDIIASDKIPCNGSTFMLSSRVTVSPESLAFPSNNALIYEWYHDNTYISAGQRMIGDTTVIVSVLLINNFSISDTGIYRFVVRDPLTGNSDTAVYRVGSVNNKVTVTISDQTICAGDTLRLNYPLSQPSSFRYSLNAGSVTISDTLTSVTNFTITVPNAQAGQYVLLISGCGVQSSTFSVAAKAATIITTQPSNQVNITAGVPLTLTVQATGSGTLTYQWFKNGVVIPGATSATYTKTVTTQADAGEYTVRVTGDCGEVTSGTSTVVISPNSVEGYAGAPGLKLEQNIPNPFSDETSVSFTIPSFSNVTLVVRDVLGRTLQTINLGQLAPGSHTSSINAANIPVGTYYYTLQTDNANITRRFLIVR